MAKIARNGEGAVKLRARSDGVRFRKSDSVAVKEIMSEVKPPVFTENHPAILTVLPHSVSPYLTYSSSSSGESTIH